MSPTGTQPPRPGPHSSAGPLSGVRILAVEQFGAGPFGSLYLADLGAEVIKIEDPNSAGDVGRYIPPHNRDQSSLYFESFNRGKQSICLDLKTPAGQRVFRDLAAQSDAVYSNLRGDLAEKLGIGYENLAERNPALVCVALTGYGRSGARSALPAYDALIQAEVGWASLTGEPDGPPVKSALSLVDFIGGLTAALSLVSALLEARSSGRGRDVDVNLYDASLAMFNYQATWLLSAGVTAERLPMSSHQSLVPFQFFVTADGHIAVGCGKEKFYQRLAALLELPALADQRFSDFAGRREHRNELVPILEDCFRSRTTEEWIATLRGSVPVAPVRSVTEALDKSELIERDMLATYESEVLGDIGSVGIPIKMGRFTPSYRPAPRLDADRASLLDGLGYADDDIAELSHQGAFGAQPDVTTSAEALR